MRKTDINKVADIHSQVFSRQWESLTWVSSNFLANPRILMYVVLVGQEVVWYIQWIQKSGLRKEVVLELEQIGILITYQGKWIWATLIKESLNLVQEYFQKSWQVLKTIYVSTRTDNKAQELYKKVLWVKEIAIIKDLYSSDEIFLWRNYQK